MMSMKCYIKKIIIKGFNAWQARISRFMVEVAYSLKQPCVQACYYVGSAAGAKRNQKQDLKKEEEHSPLPTEDSSSSPTSFQFSPIPD